MSDTSPIEIPKGSVKLTHAANSAPTENIASLITGMSSGGSSGSPELGSV